MLEEHSLWREAQPGDSLHLGHFGCVFTPRDAVWGWESSETAVVQDSPNSCGLHRSSGESSPVPGGNLKLGLVYFISWEVNSGLCFSWSFLSLFVAVTSELTPNQPISAHTQVPMGDDLHPANFFPQAAGSRLWPHSASSVPLAWRVLCHTWVQRGCLWASPSRLRGFLPIFALLSLL